MCRRVVCSNVFKELSCTASPMLNDSPTLPLICHFKFFWTTIKWVLVKKSRQSAVILTWDYNNKPNHVTCCVPTGSVTFHFLDYPSLVFIFLNTYPTTTNQPARMCPSMNLPSDCKMVKLALTGNEPELKAFTLIRDATWIVVILE